MKDLKKEIINWEEISNLDFISVISLNKKAIFSNEILDFWSPLYLLKGYKEGYEIGICEIKRPFSYFNRMEAHFSSEEILIPLNKDMFVPVAPPAESPDPDKIKLVKVKKGEIAVLKEGTWHFAAGPIENEGENLRYIVLLKNGTPKNDLKMVDLEVKIKISL